MKNKATVVNCAKMTLTDSAFETEINKEIMTSIQSVYAKIEKKIKLKKMKAALKMCKSKLQQT